MYIHLTDIYTCTTERLARGPWRGGVGGSSQPLGPREAIRALRRAGGADISIDFRRFEIVLTLFCDWCGSDLMYAQVEPIVTKKGKT